MLLSLKPFKFHIRQTVPITVSLDGQAKLDHLGFFFMPPAQSVGGTLQLDLALSGNMDKPFLHGNIRLADGSYQHMEQGVFVQNIKSHLQISPEKFEILQFTANDVNGESLEISGWLRNEPGQRAFPFEASLKAGAFQVLNSPTIFAVLKDADIRFEGDMRQQRLKGTVNLDRVEYFIKDLGGSSVPELKVTEIPSPEEEEKARPHRQRPFAPRLDLNINFPGKLFVRGRGLDSEWRGSLAIFGRSQNPGVRGTIDLVKGHIDFLGKQLDVKEGQVLLDGSRPPNPYISVKAEQEGKEVLSILKIDGQPANLKFALSSEPPLPEDEILAQMLFDRSISTISPVQAAQLAWAIGELSGVTQTPDVLGMAREMLGFDDLNLVSNGDDPDDLRIRAGKYVHERVYLKIEKDLKTDDDLIAADVELSRRFTFEGQLGTNNSGLGLYWKRDF